MMSFKRNELRKKQVLLVSQNNRLYSKASFITTELDPVGGLNDSDWTITPN